MALAAFSDRSEMTKEELETSEHILKEVILKETPKDSMRWSPYFDIGVTSTKFKNLAGKFSDRLFDLFYEFAFNNCKKG